MICIRRVIYIIQCQVRVRVRVRALLFWGYFCTFAPPYHICSAGSPLFLQKFSQAKIKKNKVGKLFKNGHLFLSKKCPIFKSGDGIL
jgi:hypothetical protein